MALKHTKNDLKQVKYAFVFQKQRNMIYKTVKYAYKFQKQRNMALKQTKNDLKQVKYGLKKNNICAL